MQSAASDYLSIINEAPIISIMQGYTTPSLLYDDGFFGRSELNFSDVNGPGGGEPTISSSEVLLGLSDSLDRLDTASSFTSQHALGDPMDTTATQPPDHNTSGSLNQNHHSQQQSTQLGNNHPHHSSHNSFGLDDNGNLQVMQDMLHHHGHQMMNTSSNDNNHIDMGGGHNRSSSQGDHQSNGVTSQWEESLQDLQSLLALHGHQHHPQININGVQQLPMTPDQPQQSGAAFLINNSSSSNNISIRGPYGSSLDKGSAGFSSSKFPAAAGDSELLSLLQFPRPNSLQQQQLQAPAGPVSAFPSNPGFRKGSYGGPVNSSAACITSAAAGGGFYSSSSSSGQTHTTSSSFPYTAPSLVGSNYFNINPGGGLGNLNSFMNSTTLMQKQQLMRAPSIIDLEQARDHCSEGDNGLQQLQGGAPGSSAAPAVKFSSSLFESAKRGGSDSGSLLLSGKAGSEPRGINHFATERQRREYLNEKYQTLRSLVPNPTKADRASIVADAIEYVKELKRAVQELQILVREKQRETSLKETAHYNCSAHKRRRDMDHESYNAQSGGGGGGGADVSPTRSFSLNNGKSSTFDLLSDGSHLRSSWLQRTSQSTGTHVDVRIVHDEMTIKLTKRRRKQPGGRQLLLHVMLTFYELQLDLQHANGANIGEHDIYIFNTKILEGSSTFAGTVVTKLLEAVDRE